MAAHKPKIAKDAPVPTPVRSEAKDKLVWTPPADRKQVFNDICTKLSEFFDAGVLTVTWQEQGKTLRLHQTMGNNFAIAGLLEQLAMEHSDGLSQELEDDDDDDDDNEDWKKGKKAPA